MFRPLFVLCRGKGLGIREYLAGINKACRA